MARGDQLARQWAILRTLTQRRCSRRELAQEFGVSRRTISRDIDALSQFPIVEDRDGIDVFYECLAGFRPPPISLPAHEVAALLLGRSTVLAALEGAPFREDYASALDRLDQFQLGARHRQLRSLPRVFHSAFDKPDVQGPLRDQLLEAAMRCRRVEMNYFTARRQAHTRRKVDPYVVHFHPRGVQLIGYCLLRSAFLQFDLQHITGLEVLDERFEPKSFNLDEFVAEGFDGHRSLPVLEVCLLIRAPTADWARNWPFHPTQQISERPEGIEVRFRAGGSEAIIDRVMSLGPDCEVLSPGSLRQAIADRAAAIASNYAPP